MAFTKDEIIRLAYNAIGIDYNVTNVATDESLNGRRARDAWNQAVSTIFSNFMWNFAKKRQQLSQVVLPPPPQNWANLYQIPPEAISIHLITIWPRGPYEIWGQYIAANINPLWLDYQILPAVSAWPDIFSMYVMYYIAEILAPNAAQNSGVMGKMESYRKDYEAKAQVYVSQNQTAVPIMSAPFISIRNTYPGNYGFGWWSGNT